MPRFSVTAGDGRSDVAFDDGGMNLLSASALRELREVVAACAGASRLLTFRSSRAGLFAAGADMAEMQQFTAAEAEAFARLGQETFAAIERLPILTVAIVDGDCFGGALDLALSFDVRLATPRSRFSHPGARLGIVTGFGGTSRWRRAIGRRAIGRLFLANEVLTAEEAGNVGLVDFVADAFDGPLSRLASIDAATVRLVKDLSRHASRLSQSELVLLSQRLAAVYAPN